MSMTMALAVIWVIAATIVAVMPLHHQFRPGSLLLAASPPMLVMLALDFGLLVGMMACCAFVSMFRHPLRYFWSKLRATPGDPQ